MRLGRVGNEAERKRPNEAERGNKMRQRGTGQKRPNEAYRGSPLKKSLKVHLLTSGLTIQLRYLRFAQNCQLLGLLWLRAQYCFDLVSCDLLREGVHMILASSASSWALNQPEARGISLILTQIFCL